MSLLQVKNFFFSLFFYLKNQLLNFNSKKMATPALKDLPKVDTDLKSQLEGFSANRLSHTETQEKNVLPSAEGKLIFVRHFFNHFFL